jgi:hypothetical protein
MLEAPVWMGAAAQAVQIQHFTFKSTFLHTFQSGAQSPISLSISLVSSYTVKPAQPVWKTLKLSLFIADQ